MVLSLVILGKSLNKSKNQKTADQPKYSVILMYKEDKSSYFQNVALKKCGKAFHLSARCIFPHTGHE